MAACSSSLWTEKYRPKGAVDVVGHADIVESLRTWLGNATHGRTRSAVEPGFFLWGNPGLGKTSLVHAVCRDMGFQCIEYNASDVRSLSMLSKLRAQLFASRSVRSYFEAGTRGGARSVVLLDEIDGIVSSDGMAEIVRWVSDPARVVPLVFSSNTPLPALRDLCRSHMVLPATTAALAAHLLKIAQAEKLKTKLAACKCIAQDTHGDVRAAINRLQFGDAKGGSTANSAKGPSSDTVHANADMFAYLLHPECPLEALQCWTVGVPCPQTLAESQQQFVASPWGVLVGAGAKQGGEGGALLPPKRSKYSMLSQWSLYKKNRKAVTAPA